MRSFINIIGCVAISVVTLSCTGSKNSSRVNEGSEALYMFRWELTELRGTVVKRSEKFDPYLLFFPGEPGNITGSAGCNQLKGTFTLSDADRITIEAMATTRMACSRAEREYEFIEALGNVTRWRIRDGRLSLSDDKQQLLGLTAVTQTGG